MHERSTAFTFSPEFALPHVFTVGLATLINGDASDLAQHYAGRADLVVTDPPYRLTSGGKAKKDGKHRVMGGVLGPDAYDNSGSLMEAPSWAEIAGVVRKIAGPDAEAYVMANDKNTFEAHAELIGAGWKFHNLLAWDKVHPTANRWYMKHLEFVLYLWVGKAKCLNNPGSKQLASMHAPRGEGKFHKTQKPVDLMRHYVLNSSQPGDLVMDPYAGSATTLIAAANEGRRAVGFEKDPEIFRNACRRMSIEVRTDLDAGVAVPSPHFPSVGEAPAF